MKYNSTFVVNLDSDKERWVAFQSVNQKRIEDIQRIPATTLIHHGELLLPLTQKQSKESEVEKGAIIEDDADAVELKTQQMYFDQYPALQYLAKHDGVGSAACSLSHLRLFQHLLDHDAHYDYMFVFEDDIEILDPLLDSGVVMAPNNADLILLSEASLGHVNVSWRKKGRGIRAATKDDNQKLSNKNAIRVTSGYSAWGYIITKRGARIILDEYKHERTEPMDVYFFKNPNLKVYLPTSDWPVVAHGKLGIKSSRRDRDTLNNS
jgi:GR25 family glycosyltransferase involved in LPS biosynthesis